MASQDLQANVEIFLALTVLGLALIQAIVGLLSYGRLRNRRLLLIAVGFLAFALKGAYLTVEALASQGTTYWIVPLAGLDVAILVLLYFAVRSR